MARRFEPTRALEIIDPRYGSGYRIGGSLVLTSAHLVPPSVGAPCRVRFRSDGGGGVWDATVVWLAPGWDGPDARADRDVALIALSDDAGECEPAMFGRLPGSVGAPRLEFDLFGWPRWGQTTPKGRRALAGGRHVDGIIYLADTSAEGLLVLEPSRRPDPADDASGSEWAGLSGAAVFCDGLIVGVQRHHQNPRRSGSLEAVALEHFADDEDLRRVLDAAGIEPSWPTPGYDTSPLGDRLRSISGVGHVGQGAHAELRTPSEPKVPTVAPGLESDRAFGVPLYPTRYFAGRSDALQELEDALGSPTRPNLVVITGDAGVGKTQLAVEYAYAQRDVYDVIWWVRADRPELLAADLADLASQGPLASDPSVGGRPDVEDRARAVRAWLERNDRWLLVFDNAGEFADIGGLLPRGRGHVVVTSRRDAEWGPIARELLLDVLDPASAAGLLQRRSGEDDEQAAADLASELGYLPLALEQAGSFIAQTAGFSLSRYLLTFRDRSAQLLARGKPFGYERTVATTWDLAFEQLRDASPDALELLNMFSFFGPDDIPTTVVFETLAEDYGVDTRSDEAEPLDTLELADAVGALRAYGLVRGAGDSVFVHRLLQTVVRGSLAADEQEWASIALQVIRDALDASIDESAADADRLAPHALAAAAHGERLDVDADSVSSLLDLLGTHYLESGHYSLAVSVHERALTLLEGRLPEDDPTFVHLKSNLGLALWRHGDLARSRILLQDALALGERLWRDDDPGVAALHRHLGLVLHARGELAAARSEFERAIALAERTLGADHVDLVGERSNLGMVLQAQGELAAARAEFERAIALGESTLGRDHHELFIPRSNLAVVLQAQGDLAAARVEFERAIAFGEKTLGADHPALVIMHANLALAFQADGDIDAARREYERAIELGERTLGPDHPDLVVPHSNLGLMLRAQGELDAARAECERAIAIGKQKLGQDHPTLVVPHSNLGIVLRSQGDLAGARVEFERATALAEQQLGRDHPDLVGRYSNLGWVLEAQGELDAARVVLERAIALGEQKLGADHPALIVPHSNLGSVLLAQGDPTAARVESERAIALGEQTLGRDHPDLVPARSNLGAVLQAEGEVAAARAQFERAIAVGERLGPLRLDVANAKSHLGVLLQSAGDAPAAKAAHEGALEIKQAVLGPDHPHVGSDLYWLALAEQALGELDLARSHLQQAIAIEEAQPGQSERSLNSKLAVLGDLEQQAGDTLAARQAYRRAVENAEATLARDDVQIGYLLRRLARAERDLGDLGTARTHFLREIAIERAAPSNEEESVAHALAELGAVERKLGLDREAEQTLSEAIDRLSRLPTNPVATLTTALRDHARASAATGDLPAAKASFEWALAASSARSSSDEPAAEILEELRPILAGLGTSTPAPRPAADGTSARDWVFELRRGALEDEDIRALLGPALEDVFADTVPLRQRLEGVLPAGGPDAILPAIISAWDAREAELGEELIRTLERYLLIEVVDERWPSAQESRDFAALVWQEFLTLLFAVEVSMEDPEPDPAT